MSEKSNTFSVSETQPKNYDSRYICQGDLSDYSVELVIQFEEGSADGVLTVWDKEDIIINNLQIEVFVESERVEAVEDYFDQFLMGQVDNYLKSY